LIAIETIEKALAANLDRRRDIARDDWRRQLQDARLIQ